MNDHKLDTQTLHFECKSSQCKLFSQPNKCEKCWNWKKKTYIKKYRNKRLRNI